MIGQTEFVLLKLFHDRVGRFGHFAIYTLSTRLYASSDAGAPCRLSKMNRQGAPASVGYRAGVALLGIFGRLGMVGCRGPALVEPVVAPKLAGMVADGGIEEYGDLVLSRPTSGELW